MKLASAAATVLVLFNSSTTFVAATDDTTHLCLLQRGKKGAPFNDSVCFDKDEFSFIALYRDCLDEQKSVDTFLLSASIAACVNTFCGAGSNGLELGSDAQNDCIDYCNCSQTFAFTSYKGLTGDDVFLRSEEKERCNAIGCSAGSCNIKFVYPE